MSPTIVRRPRAESDLIAIWSYIADDNESAADGLLARIEAALKRLAANPLSGGPRPELTSPCAAFQQEDTSSSTARWNPGASNSSGR